MAKTLIKAYLVGMRYQGIAQGAAVIAPNDRPSLRREPNNPHDRNAIAVEVCLRCVGYIDRDNAAILAPILDRGATYEASLDPSRYRTNGGIPLAIIVESRSDAIAPPKVASARTAGIYRLFVIGHQQSYFGQARDIQERIVQHWKDLNKGIHDNPVLRQLWYDRGGAAFRAEVFEAAPEGMNDLALARWLLDRERHWIRRHGGVRTTMNRREPELVLTPSAKRELSQEWKEQKQMEKEQRKRDRDRYNSLKSLQIELRGKISALRSEQFSIKKRINSATGIRGFLFGSQDEKQNLPALRGKLHQISAALEPLEKHGAEIESEFKELRRKLYPGRRKIPLGPYW